MVIPVPFRVMITLSTNSSDAPLGWNEMPVPLLPRKSEIVELTTCTEAAERTRTPLRPVPTPSMSRPLRYTTSVAAALTTMALVPDTRTPPSVWSQMIEIDLVIVTPPKPPGSKQLISPPAAVFEIAPANVLQGAVRLQGFASSPTPETQVRVACAEAGATLTNKVKSNAVNATP